jgi:hypothetical protein
VHGSEESCRPSSAIGVRIKEPLLSCWYVPCCHCMSPDGHAGSTAVATC